MSIDRDVSVLIERAGTWVFFLVVGFFALWILKVFFGKLAAMRVDAGGNPLPAGAPLIVHRRKFLTGAAGLFVFAAVFAFGHTPLLEGKSVWLWADDLFNRLAKHSTDYIPEARKKAEKFNGVAVDIAIHPRDLVTVDEFIRVVKMGGCDAKPMADKRIRLTGDLGRMAEAALADAELAFGNDAKAIEEKYRMNPSEVNYCWWILFDGLARRYMQENQSGNNEFAKFLSAKVFEPAYNFRGIVAENASQKMTAVVGLLLFYVLYTVWYGFSILYLFEGFGISVTAAKEKKES
jgi:hypothetical protein